MCRYPISGKDRQPRRGGSLVFFVVGLAILLAVVGGISWYFLGGSEVDEQDKPLVTQVKRAPYEHVVLAQGEVESSENVEVRCEVRSRASRSEPSTSIIDVIEEGKSVKEGDWLITFDSSSLEQEKLAEQIILNTMESEMIEAKATYDTALFNQEEFLTRGLDRINVDLAKDNRASGGSSSSHPSGASQSGAPGSNSSASSDSSSAQSNSASQSSSSQPTQSSSDAKQDRSERGPAPLVNPSYGELKRFIENEVSEAEGSLRKAQLAFDSAKRRVARGLVGELQLERERFRLRAAQNSMDLAKQKLAALQNHTRKKMLVQLKASFEAAEVRYRSAVRNYEEQRAKVKEIEDQIAKCKVYAPQAGHVVYANVQSRRSGSEFIVEPGALVRERQVVLRLPDPSRMQVRAEIDESRINLVEEGMPVTMRIDAFRDMTVNGEVIKVNKFAEPGNRWSSSVKKYATLIEIHKPPPGIRVGLTAEVQIHIEHRSDALQVPVQAVYERGEKSFCLVRNGKRYDTREVVTSASNEKFVALDEEQSEPLSKDEKVVMNPRKHLDLFDKSRLPKESDSTAEKPDKELAEAKTEKAADPNAESQDTEKVAQPSKPDEGRPTVASGGAE